MRVLFVCSGNSAAKISPVLENQGLSLIKKGISLDFYTIEGKGFWGYIKSITKLKRLIKKKKFDIIHAHYSFSAFVATLAGCKPLIVSLMGSDAYMGSTYRSVIFLLHKIKWDKTIVKSSSMNTRLNLKEFEIIPNGVDLSVFFPINTDNKNINFKNRERQKTILFPSNPGRIEKNYKLVKRACNLIKDHNIKIEFLLNIKPTEVPVIINNADIMVLPSLWEGSPNVIKEAMACNCPIVATDVGDISWLFGNEPGHFIASFDPEDLAEKILLALDFSEKHNRTNGRERIIKLGLDDETIANRIINVYEKYLN